MPLARSQFDLSAQEFRDGLALCYRKPLLSLPAVCDGCGAPFSIEHALDCHFGGLVSCRHNEVCDAFGELASLVWSPVVKEPVVQDGSASADALIADLCVRGVWGPQTEALFDIRVVDTDTRSYCACSLKMFYVLLRVRRSTSICRLVRIDVPHLLHFVYLYMAFLVLRLSFLLGN